MKDQVDIINSVIAKVLEPMEEECSPYTRYIGYQRGRLMACASSYTRDPMPKDDMLPIWISKDMYLTALRVLDCDDYASSIKLQNQIKAAQMDEMFHILRMLSPIFVRLSCTKYGNFVIQALIDVAHKPVLDMIVCRLQGSFIVLSLDQYGIFVLLKLFDGSTIAQRHLVYQELAEDLEASASSFNAFRIWRKILEQSSEFMDPFITSITLSIEGWSRLACTLPGCAFIKLLIPSEIDSSQAIDSLLIKLGLIVEDPIASTLISVIAACGAAHRNYITAYLGAHKKALIKSPTASKILRDFNITNAYCPNKKELKKFKQTK